MCAQNNSENICVGTIKKKKKTQKMYFSHLLGWHHLLVPSSEDAIAAGEEKEALEEEEAQTVTPTITDPKVIRMTGEKKKPLQNRFCSKTQRECDDDD